MAMYSYIVAILAEAKAKVKPANLLALAEPNAGDKLGHWNSATPMIILLRFQ
jgi:hypothetical protein